MMEGAADPDLRWGRAEVLLAAVLYSTGGAAIKAATLSPWQIAASRSLLAAAVLLVALPQARRGWTGAAWLTGIMQGLTMVLFVWANRLTTAVNTMLLQDTAPGWVLLLSPWLLHERLRLREVVALTLMGAGLLLILAGHDAPTEVASAPELGNLLALASGVTWAGTILGLRHLQRPGNGAARGSATAAVVIGNLVAAGVAMPFAFPVPAAGWSDAAAVLYLGVFQIGVAYILLTGGLRKVRAAEASLLLLAEPVLAPVWAWLLHGETFGPATMAGGALILTAVAWRALSRETGAT